MGKLDRPALFLVVVRVVQDSAERKGWASV